MNAFRDLKVLELGRVFSGPLCGMLLADLGARVLKVEQPAMGDESRGFGHHGAGGTSCYFNSLNRNKKSVALDLKKEEDRAVLLDLVRKADVLVHNWIQSSLDKLGFSYEDLKKLNPSLIYCGISGYGLHTPDRDKPAQDLIAQAVSGFMSLTGEADGPPLKTGIPVVDYGAGLYAAFAITAALYRRKESGEGCFVSVSLLETALAMTSFASSAFLSTGAEPVRSGNRHPSIAPYNLYETADGPIVLAVANDAMWKRCCRALGLDAIADDPRFADNDARLANREALEETLAGRLRGLSSAAALAALEAAKVSCAPVNSLAEAFASDAVKSLGMVLDFGPRNSSEDGIRVVGSPLHFDVAAAQATTAPPELGADDEEIRRERDW